MKTYNILWIDDLYKTNDSFITNAELEGVVITPFEISKDGMEAFEKNISHWDGIVLDAKCWLDSSDEKADTDAMYYSIRKITELKYKRNVPYFIYTGQPDLLSDLQFEKSLGGKRFYVKGKDDEKLISDIIIEADKLPETQIRHEYADVFDSYSDHESLLRILSGIKNNDNTNPSYFNEIRKVVEDVFDGFESNYLFPKGCADMNARSRFLGSNDLKEIIPVYIQRNLFSVISITQEGSHRLTIDEAVKSGKAPYLIQSTVLELLTILVWANEFLKSADSDKLKAEIATGKFENEGIVEKDENGNYFCGTILLPYKLAEANLGCKIKITKHTENTNSNKDLYPFFALKFDKI